MKTKLFIDFDDTLFDRNSFKDGLFDIVRSFGLSDDELETSYRAVYKDGYEGIWAQLDYINKNIRPIDLEKAHKKVNAYLEKSNKFLFKQSVDLLRAVDRNLFELILITVGGVEFQKMKVESCGIEKYFDQVIYTTNNKATELTARIPKDEVFVLVDDKPRELEGVSEAFPKALVFKADRQDLLKFANPLESAAKGNI